MAYLKELTREYDIYEQIGASGGGIVYRAYYRNMRKDLVLKQIVVKSGSTQEYRAEVVFLDRLFFENIGMRAGINKS